MSAPNPIGDFAGLDPDYDLGPIHVQWVDLGGGVAGKVHVVWENRNYVWDGVSAWVRMTQPSGGGGGGAVTIEDSVGDSAMDDANNALRVNVVAGGAGGGVATQGARDGTAQAWFITFNGVAQPVTGTFWQATQPISAASLPLPTGAATESTLATLLTLAGFQARINTLGQKAMSASTPVVLSSDQSSIPVTGTFFQATQPVSGVNFDIRDLVFATDKVDASGSSVSVSNFPATQPVSATNLDIRDLVFAQDKVDASGSSVSVSNFPGTQPVSGTVSTKTDLAPSSPASASVGVSSAQAVAANGSRKGLVLVNVSNNRISFGIGAAAVLDSGITLYPGGVWTMDEYTFDTGAINAIASAAASPLAIQEFA